MAPSAALLRPTLWQEHATIAILHWFLSEVQPCQPSESPALTLLLKEGQYDKGGRTKCAPLAGCCTFLFLPAPQGYTRPDQTSRLDSQWLALSLPCALPLSIPSFCCSLGWTVHSSIPAAALSGPGDFSWETRWVILPQCGKLSKLRSPFPPAPPAGMLPLLQVPRSTQGSWEILFDQGFPLPH